MKVSEAADSRMSCRAFRPDPIPVTTLRSLVERASRAPSGSNLQPWFVHVVAGEPLKTLLSIIAEKTRDHPQGERYAYQVHPDPLAENYQRRRFRVAEMMYALLGIPREDKPARLRQFQRNFVGFDAPAILFVSVDEAMGPPQWSDLGMFVQTFMLLAREEGLHTCAQESWAGWNDALAEFLKLPEKRMIFCGVSVGRMDEEHPINALRSEREPLDEFAVFLCDDD